MMVSASSILVLAVTVFVCISFLLTLSRLSQTKAKLATILFVALLVRIALVIAQEWVVLPDSTYDAVRFDRVARDTAAAWMRGEPGPVPLRGAYRYAGFVAGLYTLFGHQSILARLVNALLGTVTVCAVSSGILVSTRNQRLAQMGGWLAALWPTQILYSTLLLREAFVAFGLSLSFLYFNLYRSRQRLSYLLVSLAALAFAGLFHDAVLLVGVGYGITLLLGSRRVRLMHVLAVVAVMLILLPPMAVKLTALTSTDTDFVETLGRETGARAAGRTSYLSSVQPKNVLDLFWQTPLRTAYMLFTPFVWNVRTVGDLLGLLDALLNIAVFIGILRTPKGERRKALLILIPIMIALVAFSWGTSNVGTAIRHRAKFFPMLVVSSAPSLGLIRHRITGTLRLPTRKRVERMHEMDSQPTRL